MTKKQTDKNTKDIQKILASHQEHLIIANTEMGVVKEELSLIKNDISWIKTSIDKTEKALTTFNDDTKKALDKFDNRTWTILATIVIGFLANLYFK